MRKKRTYGYHMTENFFWKINTIETQQNEDFHICKNHKQQKQKKTSAVVATTNRKKLVFTPPSAGVATPQLGEERLKEISKLSQNTNRNPKTKRL